MAYKVQLVEPMPDFLSVAVGCEVHLLPCSMTLLEHVIGKCHHLGPFLQSAPASDYFFCKLSL